MEIDLAHGELSLAENKPLRILGASGVVVHCVSGTIWITTEGHADDVFLEYGQRHLIDSNKLTLIESIDDGHIRFEPPLRHGVHLHRIKRWGAKLHLVACRRTPA